MFKDRTEAGQILAKALAQYKGKDAVVCALPRGGVGIGYEVAKFLQAPLDIVVTRKIAHPENPEYAICAVDEKGFRICDSEAARFVDQEWLERETLRQTEEALRRIEVYRKGRKPEKLSGKTVILVDDGIATGLSMRAAIKRVRRENPKEIIVATPVAPRDTIEELGKEVDQMIALENGRNYLGAVGSYYASFPQVSDDEVIELLEEKTKL